MGGFQPCKDDAVDDRCAQEAAIPGGLGERVTSVPLLPFPFGRRTEDAAKTGYSEGIAGRAPFDAIDAAAVEGESDMRDRRNYRL